MLRLLLLLTALCLHAQSWDAVRALRPGDRVKVQETTGAGHKGAVTTVTTDSIAIASGKNQLSFDRARVRRVEVKSGNRRLRNVAIGAGVGLAVGITADQTLGAYLRNEVTDSGRPLFYVVPIGLFGGIGAALAPYKTIYRVK
jgi:hypothetical protein